MPKEDWKSLFGEIGQRIGLALEKLREMKDDAEKLGMKSTASRLDEIIKLLE